MSRTKGGTPPPLAGREHKATSRRGCAHGMSVRCIITEGTRADCKESSKLTEGIDADHLLADKAYDTNDIVEQAKDLKGWFR